MEPLTRPKVVDGLVVVTREVGDAADGWAAAEGGVWAR
jgi:hypothetical protein